MLQSLLCGEPIVGARWVSKPSSVYTKSTYYMNPEITRSGVWLYTLSDWKTIKRHKTLSVFDKDTRGTQEKYLKRLKGIKKTVFEWDNIIHIRLGIYTYIGEFGEY